MACQVKKTRIPATLLVAGVISVSLLNCSGLPAAPHREPSSVPPPSDARFPGLFAGQRQLLSFSRSGQTVDITTTTFPLRVEVLADDLVKVRFASQAIFPPEYTWSVAKSDWSPVYRKDALVVVFYDAATKRPAWTGNILDALSGQKVDEQKVARDLAFLVTKFRSSVSSG